VVIGSGMVLVIDHLGRLARIVSGIVPMRWEVMSVMPVITADIMSRMVPAIMAVAHPEDRADDHGRQDRQDRPGMG
jgi:hypothetical protein